MNNTNYYIPDFNSVSIDENTKNNNQASDSYASRWVEDLYKIRDVCFDRSMARYRDGTATRSLSGLESSLKWR